MGALDTDSWYLVYVGTKPTECSKGYAKKVIEYVTRQADKTGKACYLESSLDQNKAMYEKRGFKVEKEIFLQRGKENVKMDIMVREPR